MKIGEEKIIENEFERLIIRRKATDVMHLTKQVFDQRRGHDRVVTGDGWLVWKFHQVDCRLDVKSVSGEISIDSSMSIFTPPCTIVPYYKGPGTITIEMIGRMHAPPSAMGDKPFAFKNPESELPGSAAELEAYVLSATERIPIGPRGSAIARRCRERIAATYSESPGIAEIARQLRCSHTVMSRLFRQAYGLSPGQYQQQLRVFDSMRLMLLCDENVAEAAAGVGYESRSKYNQAFRRLAHVQPSAFRS